MTPCTNVQLVDLHFNPANSYLATSAESTTPTMSRSSSSTFPNPDKRKFLLSIDGALDALKTREMWKGIKGVANPPNQVEENRKRSKLSRFGACEIAMDTVLMSQLPNKLS